MIKYHKMTFWLSIWSVEFIFEETLLYFINIHFLNKIIRFFSLEDLCSELSVFFRNEAYKSAAISKIEALTSANTSNEGGTASKHENNSPIFNSNKTNSMSTDLW